MDLKKILADHTDWLNRGMAGSGRASLTRADLTGAVGIIHAGAPNSWQCHGWLRGGWLSIRVGCREKRLAEAREYWKGKENRREVLAALDYIEAIAKLRGWPTTEEGT